MSLSASALAVLASSGGVPGCSARSVRLRTFLKIDSSDEFPIIPLSMVTACQRATILKVLVQLVVAGTGVALVLNVVLLDGGLQVGLVLVTELPPLARG